MYSCATSRLTSIFGSSNFVHAPATPLSVSLQKRNLAFSHTFGSSGSHCERASGASALTPRDLAAACHDASLHVACAGPLLQKSGRSRPERGRTACARTDRHLQPSRGSTSSWITGRKATFCSRGAIMERADKPNRRGPLQQGCNGRARALCITSAARDLVAHRACSFILPSFRRLSELHLREWREEAAGMEPRFDAIRTAATFYPLIGDRCATRLEV